MKKIYRLLDYICDPPPKWLRQKRYKPLISLYYDSQSEDFKRYKHACYRDMLLKSLLSYLFGLLFGLYLFNI